MPTGGSAGGDQKSAPLLPGVATQVAMVSSALCAVAVLIAHPPDPAHAASTKQHMTFGEFYPHCAFTTRWHRDCCCCMHAALLLLRMRRLAP